MQGDKRNIGLIIGIVIIAVIIGYAFGRTGEAPTVDTGLAPVDTATEEGVSPESTTPASPQAAPGGKSTTATGVPAKTTPPPPALTGKPYKEFIRPTGYLNTNTLGLADRSAFTLKEYIGKKVILLNFWTTSSTHSLHMLPYLNQWHEKYKNKGLLVISIHTPRFAFEKTNDVVERTAAREGVIHPIVTDNNFETWNAYGNSVWPHRYLIDINGRIVSDIVGEGSYEATEAKIQQLLVLRAEKLGEKVDAYAPFSEPKNAVVIDLPKVKTPETYFGSARNGTLANGVPYKDGNQDFAFPSTEKSGVPYLSGSWTFTKEFAKSLIAGTKIRLGYSAKSVSAVMSGGGLSKIKVLRDGVALTPENAGKDIRFEKGESYFFVQEARIYDIVNDTAGYGDHKLELILENSGTIIYTITFG